MRELSKELKDIKLAIFDLDGVIYRGNSLIPKSDEVIKDLKENSVKIVYNTNNSTATRRMYVDRLKEFNIISEINDIFTSASITAGEITNLKQNATIFVIGEIGLREELEMKGHTVVNFNSDSNEVDYVIVGMDRNFNYKKLAFAQNCILQGNAQFYATNADSTFPVANRLLPGAGVMVNALQTCTNQKPLKIFGKPNPFGISAILKNTDTPPEKAVIFGDRLNTDILAGNRAKINTVLVLTGITKESDVKKLRLDLAQSLKIDKDLNPDLVINTLEDIFIK
ncbi:MAG: HAD-IIA family hydrolase [Candidatus Lokiarchaeota archaeon]|nr:HAD-IIA family hydrolase [Candidatus Lokiarchaeota archaeon]